MKIKKRPGTDGFPIEFYKLFWRDIGTFLIQSLNESYLMGELSMGYIVHGLNVRTQNSLGNLLVLTRV